MSPFNPVPPLADAKKFTIFIDPPINYIFRPPFSYILLAPSTERLKTEMNKLRAIKKANPND